MSIAFPPRSMMPVGLLAGSCFIAGLFLSGAIVSHFAESKAAAVERQTTAVRARITLLESVLRKQADSTASLSVGPDLTRATPAAAVESTIAVVAPAPVGTLAPIPAAQGTVAHGATPKKERAIRAAVPPLPDPEVAAPAIQRATAPVARVAPTPEAIPKPVTAEALAAAKASNKIEGIGAEKIGVSKIDPSGVVMRNGGRIPVGGRFPSGERLLGVDPATNQIITDARTVLVFTD